MNHVLADIKEFQQELIAIRRDIHKHPETAFEEHRTSQLVADRLTQWGLEIHRGLAKTGVVGTLVGRSPGITIVSVRRTHLPNSSIKGDGVRVFLSGRDHPYRQDFYAPTKLLSETVQSPGRSGMPATWRNR
ncbi:hypothetical protein OH706_17780, partial [Pseudomonas sp. M3]